MEDCAYRLEVVSEFLKAGIPLGKIDMLRSLLEKYSYRLTGSSKLGQYVSMTLKQEIERIKQELEMSGQGTFQSFLTAAPDKGKQLL